MPGFVKVATVDEIPEGSFKSLEVDFDRIVIAHTADGYFAFADQCTHDGEPFGKGKLKGHEIICTRHGARFDVRTGAATSAPAIVPVDTFETKVDGRDILVRLE